MNKKRKQELNKISIKLDALLDQLDDIYNDEQIAYDSMPENLQGSDRGMESEEAVDAINEAKEQIQEAIDLLNEIA